QWASFDGTVNPPIAYPQGTNSLPARSLDISLYLHQSPAHIAAGQYTWHAPMPLGRFAALQISSELSYWTTVITVVNNGTEILWDDYMEHGPIQFFRVVPQ